jgi:hypothetical protein
MERIAGLLDDGNGQLHHIENELKKGLYDTGEVLRR